MTDPKYAAFTALDPFFQIAPQGLAGLVDGDHYFETIADDAVFEFRYDFPGWPRTVSGRDALMNLISHAQFPGRPAGLPPANVVAGSAELSADLSIGGRLKCFMKACRKSRPESVYLLTV